jgi:hypothetical protein
VIAAIAAKSQMTSFCIALSFGSTRFGGAFSSAGPDDSHQTNVPFVRPQLQRPNERRNNKRLSEPHKFEETIKACQ